MERLTLSEARARVAAQMSTANVIDWTQPDREALLVAGLLPGASSQDERDALQDGPGSIEAASRRVRAWLRKQGR